MNRVLYLPTSFHRLFFLLRSKIRLLGELRCSRGITFRREVVENEGVDVTIERNSRQLWSLLGKLHEEQLSCMCAPQAMYQKAN